MEFNSQTSQTIIILTKLPSFLLLIFLVQWYDSKMIAVVLSVNRTYFISRCHDFGYVFRFLVTKFDDIQSWLDVGNQQRVTASTGMNDKSSRSHSVFILNVIRTTVSLPSKPKNCHLPAVVSMPTLSFRQKTWKERNMKVVAGVVLI